MPDPNLTVSLLKPEEAEQYMRIRHEVFRPTVNKILYARREPSQETLDKVTEDIRDGITNKGILYVKCVDTSTGEIIACARWRYVKPKEEGAKERTWEEVDAGLTVPPPYEESDPEMFAELFNLFNSNKREILERRAYYVLDTLVTLPQHGRRGAGSMLVRWGCEKADEVGVEAFLEASPMGAPMYARHGFQAMKTVELDLRRWSGEDKMEFIPIYGITASLKTYKTEDVESPDPKDECYVCMRPFNAVDNKDDPNEVPCKAVRLLPCGHLIGSECLKITTLKLNMTTCSLCSAPLAVTYGSPMNYIMCHLLSNSYTQALVDHALLVGSVLASPQVANIPLLGRLHTQDDEEKMAILSYAFFARELTWADAFSFWLYYMKLVFVSLLGLSLLFLSKGLLIMLDDFYGAPIEMAFLSALMGTDCRAHLSKIEMRMVVQALCIAIDMGGQVAMRRHPEHLNKLVLMRAAAWLREAMVIFSWDACLFVGSGLLLTKTLEFVVMAAVITMLVSYGLRRGGKMFRCAWGLLLAAVMIYLTNGLRMISIGRLTISIGKFPQA
ncbi:uncharacterized protein J4E78_005870 [Alternaria triticimaculans]|uniref:uncharacterized protein n=1 Tax=Alternaria triticimaculans TaxID=297637 RepID=UPI0020C34209|nr:uncharacterized protein J4E78_005870 [Alternaria triticimaculans]KAI4659442.1 hypothetical protein J4E78_005870 [Alternaria triticimaculans]